MDGSCNTPRRGEFATVLARLQADPDGLTTANLEQLVRAIWHVTGKPVWIDEVSAHMASHLRDFGGMTHAVRESRLMAGAIDVECQFCHSGRLVNHIVHLW